jgi:peptidoglycan-associated lipoprotein
MKPQSYLILSVSKIRFIAYFLTLPILFSACNSGIKLYKKGNKKFEAGEYQLAIEKYEKSKAKNFAPSLTNIALAESYRLSDRLQKSAEYYQQAIEAGNTDEDIHYNYGFALKALGKYKEAANQFDLYLKTNPKKLAESARAKKELENLKLAEEIAKEKTYFEIQNVSALNTEATEFSPVYKNDEIVFTSSRKSLTYKANGQKFLGLYTYKFKNDSLTSGSATLFSDQLNLENLNEGCPTFSKDGKTMIFARGNTGKRKSTRDVDLYISKLKGGIWLEPKMLSVSVDSTWDSCPAISADGKTLYFASNRVGGIGGIDLYRATLDAAGRVGRAVNMGKEINTAGDDMFPYVSEDGKLYFSSDGHPGLGGLDLFVATRNEGKVKIKNLGIPLNSSYDDFALAFRSPTSGFISSNREGGKGEDDIYYFEDKTPDIKLVRYYLVGKVVTTDDKTATEKELTGVKIRFQDEDGKIIEQSVTKEDGKFGTYPLQVGKSYTILTEKEDYFTKRESFSMAGRTIPQELLTKPETDTTFEVKIRMEKVEINKTYVVKNIYYDFDKFNIREDAADELDIFTQFLNDNPQIKIELGSHTDSKGDNLYNQKLSQQRAESAVTYLISKGVSAARITAKGYGESQPVAPNENPDGSDNPEGRQENRRTEFKVLEYNKIK